MKKIKSLFKRNYDSGGLVRNEIVDGCEWVLNGEGLPSIKFDGTCCLIRDEVLFKRYDRKLTKQASRKKKSLKCQFTPTIEDFKPALAGWEAVEPNPNIHTGHWPGWVKVGDEPESKYHLEGWDNPMQYGKVFCDWSNIVHNNYYGSTYELVGPKIQGNPYNLDKHFLWIHGVKMQTANHLSTFEEIKVFLKKTEIEGLVWWHSDGRKCKIKRTDFGFEWPIRAT